MHDLLAARQLIHESAEQTAQRKLTRDPTFHVKKKLGSGYAIPARDVLRMNIPIKFTTS